MRRRAALAVSLLAVALVASGGGVVAAAVPGQLVAKLHTEALGRAPTPAEWTRWVGRFEREGCAARSVRRAARAVYAGREFRRLPYDGRDRLAALHRGLLNRDLTPAAARRFAPDARWPAVLRTVLRGPETARMVRRICDPRRAAYGFDDARGLWTPRVRGPGFRGSEEQLQAALDRTARRGGGTVWLAQRAIIRIGAGPRREQLRIPRGVTLATTGLPGDRRYLRMARLARVGDTCLGGRFCGQPVVALEGGRAPGEPGASVRSVWIDGRGGDPRLHGSAAQVESGHGSRIARSRLSGPARRGGNVVGLHGTENHLGLVCTGARLEDNVITAYTTRHGNSLWADGVTVACEDAVVQRNAIVDATDVGIALFGSARRRQRSRIAGNLVLSAGSSAFAGIAADPHGVCADACTDLSPRDFTGARVEGNVLVTGPRTAFGLGVALGIRALFDAPPDGFGAAAAANGTGAASARVTVGLGVSGMQRARVAPGRARWVVTRVNGCPPAELAASVGAGLASFEGPAPPFADVRIARCWQDAA
jgi:hypothetical protein